MTTMTPAKPPQAQDQENPSRRKQDETGTETRSRFYCNTTILEFIRAPTMGPPDQGTGVHPG